MIENDAVVEIAEELGLEIRGYCVALSEDPEGIADMMESVNRGE